MFSKGPFLAAAGMTLLLAAPAWADDQSMGVVPGVFRSEPAGGLTPTAVKVTLGGEQVSVGIAATVRGTTAIRLDLPRFEWLGEAETYPDRQFPELKVDVDGRPVSPAEDVVITAKGKDITAAVRAAGIDPYAIAETPPFVQAVPGKQAAFDALVASGAVTKAPEGMLAAWSVARTIRVAPSAGAHTVTFRYTARPAFALSTLAAAKVHWADYCLNAATAARLVAKHGLRGPVVVKRYTIPVTVDGARPGTVTLRASKEAGSVTIVCGAAGKALTDPVGEVTVRAGTDGAVRLVRIARPS